MLCERIIIYLLLVKVFYNGFFKSMLFFAAMGWGMDKYCYMYTIYVLHIIGDICYICAYNNMVDLVVDTD